MGDRFFPNEMPDFVSETTAEEILAESSEDSLLKLLSLPYSSISEKFKRSALGLKETVTKIL